MFAAVSLWLASPICWEFSISTEGGAAQKLRYEFISVLRVGHAFTEQAQRPVLPLGFPHVASVPSLSCVRDLQRIDLRG